MGFKFPSKRRMVDTNVSNIQGEATEASLKQPSFVRKRVHAFSEDQETKIKTLFEEFKGKKKCNQMIASALDGDGTFTAAQIARKLSQLGLRLRKQKSGDNMNLRDTYVSDSDGETLYPLKKRSNKKQNIISTEETPDQLSDSGDDVVLSSAFRKGNKKLSHAKFQESQGDSHNHNNNKAEAEVIKAGNEDVMMTENGDHMRYHELSDDLVDEVTDFWNNRNPGTSQKACGSRRKLRMVIDPDDED